MNTGSNVTMQENKLLQGFNTVLLAIYKWVKKIAITDQDKSWNFEKEFYLQYGRYTALCVCI